MKTTLELPDQLLRKARTAAKARGQSLSDFVIEALRDKLPLRREDKHSRKGDPKWMSGFGELRHLHDETIRVQSVIDETFGRIEQA
jgi:hypothetical protein